MTRTKHAVERVLLASAAAGLICRTVGPIWQPQVMAASFAPYLTSLGLPAAGLALRSERSGRWIPAALGLSVATAGLLAHRPERLRPRVTSGPAGAELAVMSANLLHGRVEPDVLLPAARRHDVAVLLLQEFTHNAEAALARHGQIDREFPYSVCAARPDGAGTAMFSRYPLSEPVSHTGLEFAAVSALLHVPGSADGGRALAIRTASVHPAPPWPYPLDRHRADFRRIEQLLADFAGDTAFVEHAGVADDAGVTVTASVTHHGCVIVGGDFNATLDHRQFRQLLRRGYHDAARAAGTAWLPTFPATTRCPPLIGIDHVLTRHLSATAVHSVSLPGSDHRAVIARLALPGTTA